MTALTALESIHKKGLFGDHHKKNDNDILQISEVKDAVIIRVVQYKRSKINLDEIKIDDLNFPNQNSSSTAGKDTRIIWNAPKTWLIVSSKENIIQLTKSKCKDTDFAITDISHSRAVIKIKGIQAKEVLKKGSPLNFNDFEVNKCAGTVFHGISIIIDLISNDPDTFIIFTLRSFGESFYHHLTDASLEFGYIGI